MNTMANTNVTNSNPRPVLSAFKLIRYIRNAMAFGTMLKIYIVDSLNIDGSSFSGLIKIVLFSIYSMPKQIAGITMPITSPSQKESFFRNLNIVFPFFNYRDSLMRC